MDTLHKELCTTAIVIAPMETAEALQKDVYSKWEGAELLDGDAYGSGNSAFLYENTTNYESLEQFVDEVHDMIIDMGSVAEKTAIF